MLGQLIPLGGGDPIPLWKPKLLVGRRPRCDIRLNFANISSEHCLLEMVSGYWQASDLHSSNGTKVNGERVHHGILQPGDTIAFAKCRFEIDYTPDRNVVSDVEIDPFSIGLLEKAGLQRDDESQRVGRGASSGPKRGHSQDRAPSSIRNRATPKKNEKSDGDNSIEDA
ncbi:MAG: FHA domain-containing protein [Planctomycetales bacterium]|nr:FHA domain-containing protein [Planctomycetales bacterium]